MTSYTNAVNVLEEAIAALGIRPSEERLAAYQAAQRAVWEAMRAVGSPWLVTDFATLGSPLQYPWPLLAATEADFAERRRLLLVPECPPRPEASGRITFDA